MRTHVLIAEMAVYVNVNILQDEHRSIALMMQSLQESSRRLQNPSVRPDFAALRAIIYYIESFPERLHHPTENDVLFPRVVARCPAAAPLVQELRAEHEEGAALLRDLEKALAAFEAAWPSGAAGFEEEVRLYANFQFAHMRKEEELLLPLATGALTEEDWKVVAEAFAGNPSR